MENCPAHSETIRRLDDLQKWSDERDREQETAIAGVSRRMDDLQEDVKQLKDDVTTIKETMPETITRNISGYLDSVIASTVKAFFKWFFRAVLGGAIITAVGLIIRGLLL